MQNKDSIERNASNPFSVLRSLFEVYPLTMSLITKNTQSPITILGIDPGYERVGVAILQKHFSQKDTLLFSNCFQTSKKDSHAKRLAHIAEYIRNIIQEYRPSILGIESLFFTGNQKTAMSVSEARGVILLCAGEAGLDIHEYSPPEIKMAVSGYGKADKKQIITMVPLLLSLPPKKRFDDEFDAIACALTASACYRPSRNPQREFETLAKQKESGTNRQS